MESKILLVDDEKDIVELLAEVLQSDGFTNIRKAHTGRDAITVCQAYQPDVIVLLDEYRSQRPFKSSYIRIRRGHFGRDGLQERFCVVIS